MYKSSVAMITLALFGILGVAKAGEAAVAAEQTTNRYELVRGVWMVPEIAVPDREPDGNSVIFSSRSGLIVFDTGRHAWHRDAILALALSKNKPIVAIFNSHWHLDHVSGNPMLRSRFPHLRVYASDAIEEALTGFLADSARQSATYLEDPNIPQAMREDIRADLLSIQNGTALKPDVIIGASRDIKVDGRTFRVNLAQDAATHGDLWIVDPASEVAVLGDLVTFPAPYLDTACPEGWSRALKAVDSTPFKTAVPGHGPILTHAQVARYRDAFEAFVACSASARPSQVCAIEWAEGLKSWLQGAPFDAARAATVAVYYVELLRANGGKSRYCRV